MGVELLNDILKKAIEQGASDIHLKMGSAPTQRINGRLYKMEGYSDLNLEMLNSFMEIMPPKQREEFNSVGGADYAYSLPNVCRFRVNTYLQRGTVGFAFRSVPRLDFDLESIGMPPVVQELASEKRGLVLVTGITGSGKSTTLAAMIDYINRTEAVNIITLEDPIEFIHNDKKSLVSQREVRNDTDTFFNGLRSALRQDPDVILVGEMRDVETIETVLHAAETGHMVFSTLHTLDALETLNRIISMFPANQEEQIRTQLSSVLRGIVSQRLIPRSDGRGRVPATEILINTSAVQDAIIEADKTFNIPDLIKKGRSIYRSQTFDQSMYDLVKADLVSEEEAMNWVKSKSDFKLMLKGIGMDYEA